MTLSKLLRFRSTALNLGTLGSAGIVAALGCFVLTGASAVAAEPQVGASSALAAAAKGNEGSGPAVTFAGFHVFPNGSSRIWVKLTSEVTVDVHPAKDSVTYVFRGARVPIKNNKNPLLTSDFSSPVMSARLIPTKHDAELIVALREKVTPKYRVVHRPDGTVSVQVDFPASTAAAPAAPETPTK